MKPSLVYAAIFFAAASCVCVCSQKVLAVEGLGMAKGISIQNSDNSNTRSAVSRIEPVDSKAVTADKFDVMANTEQKDISLQKGDPSAPDSEVAQQSNASNNSMRLPNRSQTVIRSRGLKTSSQN